MLSVIIPLMFISEIYLLVSHGLVLTRLVTPTTERLANMGLWFLFDGLSGFAILFVIEGIIGSVYSYFVLFHFIAHMFYVLTWKNGHYSKRIRNWSSYEYKKEQPYVTVDFFLTIYDMTIHAINAYLLYQNMSLFEL